MEQSPRLSLSYLMPSQAQKHVTVNESFRRLDALTQMTAASRTVTAEPGSPADGEIYILPSGASGAVWGAYSAGDIVAYQDGAWARIAPSEGLRAWVADADEFVVFDGAAWTEISSGGGSPETAAKFGINTTADATNRLAVKSDAILFSHDDVTPGNDDCQVKINKAASGDTASVLFQTNSSGRAEFGLAGDDKFHVKMSADGAAWAEAMVITSDGKVGIGTTAPAANLEVQINGNATDASLISLDNIVLTGEGAAQSFAGIVASSATNGHRMVFKGARCRGALDAPTAANDGDYTFSLLGTIYDGAVTRATAGIEMIADGAVSSGVCPQRLVIYTGETTARIQRMEIQADGSVVVGSPAGGGKGAGSINAGAVYDDNTLLSCYVFDQALDGAIDTRKWDEKIPAKHAAPAVMDDPKTGDAYSIDIAQPVRRTHEPLRKFAARARTDHDPLTLDGYAKHWREKRHLTSMPNEAAFDPDKGMATGEWIQRLVETVEIHAVLLEQLNQQLKSLPPSERKSQAKT